ncbi:MAG: hypothetical protein O2816_17740 [Planctomycetota bacterium]|nr:hypothetical protein [Planctomycetota bacterium]
MKSNTLTLLLCSLVVCACSSPGEENDTPLPAISVGSTSTGTVEAGSSTSQDESGAYAKPGYATAIVDGRLWVFTEGSQGHAEFQRTGEPATSVTLIGQGPDGMTLRGEDKAVMLNYMYAKPGFHAQVGKVADSDVLWVFAEGSESLEEFLRNGEPATSVTLIGAGPNGITLRGDDKATMLSYVHAKPGYFVQVGELAGSRFLWVFEEGSDAQREFLTSGEPAQSVTLIGRGPGGLTLRGSDREVLLAYAR